MCTSTSGAVTHRAGVAEGDRGVGERAGVEHDRQSRVRRLVQPAQQLALVIGLAHLDVQTQLAPPPTHSAVEFRVAGTAVDRPARGCPAGPGSAR